MWGGHRRRLGGRECADPGVQGTVAQDQEVAVRMGLGLGGTGSQANFVGRDFDQGRQKRTGKRDVFGGSLVNWW